MITDPSLALQGAIVTALKNAAGITSLSAGVHDAVPASAAFPYITLGEPQVLPLRADCFDSVATVFPVHGWSRKNGAAEIKRLGAAIAAALDGNEFALTGHRVVICDVIQIEYLDDPDGLTKHVVVMLRVVTETTD